jgi:hypothetical protein
MGKYQKQWKVTGSSGTEYTVSLTHAGEYQCSCPRWKFRRESCKHIQDVMGGGYPPVGYLKPRIVLAMVERPMLSGKANEALIPLVRFNDPHMEATICNFLLDHGYNIGEIREIRRLPKEWTAIAIREYIRKHGEAVYPMENKGKASRKAREAV